MPTLPDLPTELLMEIVKSYDPDLLSPVAARIHGVPRTDAEQLGGNEVLRVLSQTCRALRDRFLPIYWRRVHAYFTIRNRPKRRIRTRAKMLERRMRGIQNTPYVLPFIHSLSITLEECNMGNWQPLAHFIRVLDLLPNLRELAILQIRPEMTSIFENTCKDKVYPSIVALTLVDDLSPLLHCFPNVQALTKCTHGLSAKLLGEAKHLYNHIHTFNHFSLSTNAEYCRPVVQCLRQTIPNLRCLSLRDHITLVCRRGTSQRPFISFIFLRIRWFSWKAWTTSPSC
ncbi:hypothetical protein B0H11DRAFT_321698 [Mycena galericulata]|nr:hypothetical protein B0H11DRAFT_321698 [Mycena galericulata]